MEQQNSQLYLQNSTSPDRTSIPTTIDQVTGKKNKARLIAHDLSTGQIDEHQISQFQVQSTEQFSTRLEGQDDLKEEASIFDNKLYNQSIIENPGQMMSQEEVIAQLQEQMSEGGKTESQNTLEHYQKEKIEKDRLQNKYADDNTKNRKQKVDRQMNKHKSPSIQKTGGYMSSNHSSTKDLEGGPLYHEHDRTDISQRNYSVDIPQTEIKQRQKGGKNQERVPFPMKKTTIDRIIYPVYTKRGLKFGKKRATSQEENSKMQVTTEGEQSGKLLDGFLILYSCRVKLPHEAIKSKLASQNIVEVIEEDLCYFQNLNAIDLSDNKVKFEQLKNLKALAEVNLQFNSISVIPAISPEDFQKLEVLNLSYNQISPASIRNFYSLKRLKNLDLQGNSLITIPEDIYELKFLEELNLSSNLLSSNSTLVNPSLVFKALGRMSKLKRLNLSRNKFLMIHSELLLRDDDFLCLQEFDFGFNIVNDENDLMYAVQMKNLQILVITGNPFAMQNKANYKILEEQLNKILSAVVINDEVSSAKGYLKKQRNKNTVNFPYPNPIKLFSREVQKDIKGEYLNAELMNQGVALQISEIRPNTNIENEIFPVQLTRAAQEKDIFTPPNHNQMRFLANSTHESKQGSSSQNEEKQFFITENIDQRVFIDSAGNKTGNIIREGTQESEIEEQQEEDEEQEEEDLEDELENQNFDFGKAKMDYFKKRAKEILIGEKSMIQKEEVEEVANEKLNLPNAYKNLKQALRNPVIVHSGNSEQKPHYMKMTFAMCRNAVNGGEKFLEMSKLQQQTVDRAKGQNSEFSSILGGGSKYSGSYSKALPPLMRAGKDMNVLDDNAAIAKLLLGTQKKKTKREEQIDRKIELLLETYKRQDEEIIKKTIEKEANKKINKKQMRDKFGFSDDEEDQELQKLKEKALIYSS